MCLGVVRYDFAASVLCFAVSCMRKPGSLDCNLTSEFVESAVPEDLHTEGLGLQGLTADLCHCPQFTVQRVPTCSTNGREEEACVDPKAHKHMHMLTQQTASRNNPRVSWSGRAPSPCFKLSFPPTDRCECRLWEGASLLVCLFAACGGDAWLLHGSS